jgi:hypothetical protein
VKVSNLAKPSFADIMELIPQIMSNMEGIKIKNPEIIFDASLKAWYVSIYAEDDVTVEKINKLLPTLLGLLAKSEKQ